MIAMQYNIALPGDYDMEIIKKRIRDNGSKTDGFPDLSMKAYLIAEKSKYNNYENQYAPFYLWEKEDGMNKFLLGGPFSNILSSFGWTQVHNWMVLYQQVNKLNDLQYAIIQITPIPIYTDFSELLGNEEKNYSRYIDDDYTTAYIAAYNPLTWNLCHYYMSNDLDKLKEVSKGSLIYEVHHIS